MIGICIASSSTLLGNLYTVAEQHAHAYTHFTSIGSLAPGSKLQSSNMVVPRAESHAVFGICSGSGGVARVSRVNASASCLVAILGQAQPEGTPEDWRKIKPNVVHLKRSQS